MASSIGLAMTVVVTWPMYTSNRWRCQSRDPASA
jgi:hypothetical protein